MAMEFDFRIELRRQLERPLEPVGLGNLREKFSDIGCPDGLQHFLLNRAMRICHPWMCQRLSIIRQTVLPPARHYVNCILALATRLGNRRTSGDRHDGHLAGVRPDPVISGHLGIERGIATVDAQRSAGEAGEFAASR
jgi:hypothetical protein